MSAVLKAPMAFGAPEVSQADIEAFHATHFSNHALSLFDTQFLRANSTQTQDADHQYHEDGAEEEDDGLGYYPDGVKRTLTDEEIAIFRHSEIEALRRAERNALKQDTTIDSPATNSIGGDVVSTPVDSAPSRADSEAMDEAADGSEDGEIETEKPVLTKAEIKRQKRLRAKQRKRDIQKFQPEKKPDLRKRTWDVVDAGMDSLHYDDLEMLQCSGSASNAQRRQISYDD
ncbi:hypothetical protein F4808DRAFT_292830 [Astrocystis sublimbata]|nr:hypothetical protein F4808DRAFT_292830 [Astrocystis sublimbata]